MKVWLLLLAAGSWQVVSGQPAAGPPDTAQVNYLNKQGFRLRVSDPRASRKCLEAAASLAARLHYTKGLADAWLGLGFYYRKRDDFELGLKYTLRAAPLFRQLHNDYDQISVFYNLGYIYFGQGNYTQALHSIQAGWRRAEALRNPVWLVLCSAQMGFINTQLGEFEQARRYQQQSLRYARQFGDTRGEVQSLRGLGDLCQAQQKWALAEHYYAAGVALATRLQDASARLVQQVLVADMQASQGQYGAALRLARRTRTESRQRDMVANLPGADLVMARVQLATSHPDSALVFGRRALLTAQRSGAKESIGSAALVVAEASARLGRMAEAYRYHRLYTAYRDTLNSRDLIRRTASLRYGYALARRQARIRELTRRAALVRRQNQQQQWLLLVSLGSLVLVTGLSVFLARNVRQKQRANEQLARQQAELVSTQQQLVASEKWAFVGELSAGIAHELQNPLHFMNRLASVSNTLLTQDEASARPDELGAEIMSGLRQNLAEISQHGQRAAAIINSMLLHARRSSLPPTPTDLNALVQEQVRLALATQPPEPAVAVAQHLDPTVGEVPLVAADMGRVLLNLLTNALQALRGQLHPPPGYQPRLRVSTHRTAEAVLVRVRDNGPGISPEVRARLFEPFFTTKPVGEGTGLGLSLSYDIVTKGHGGRLEVATQPGEFTEFTVVLPA